MNEKFEADLSAIEKAILEPQPPKMPRAHNLTATEVATQRSFAPPSGRGIHELIDELENMLDLAQSQLKIIKERMDHFDRLQSGFYNGTKP